MSEPLLIEMGIGWTRNPKDPNKLTSAVPNDYVAEINRLRQRVVVLEMVIREELSPFECRGPMNEMIVSNIHERDINRPVGGAGQSSEKER